MYAVIVERTFCSWSQDDDGTVYIDEAYYVGIVLSDSGRELHRTEEYGSDDEAGDWAAAWARCNGLAPLVRGLAA